MVGPARLAVCAEQGRIQRRPQDQPGQMVGRQQWVFDMQQAPLRQAPKLMGERSNHPLGHTLVIVARKLGEPASFPDHQASELHRLRLEHGANMLTREGAQLR